MTVNKRAVAHLDGALGEPHWLDEHLRAVAELASEFASRLRPGDEAFAATAAWAGLLHDLGKFRPEFQEYLHGHRDQGIETRHSVYGAYWSHRKRLPLDLAFTILGHHAGLHDFTTLKNHFRAVGEDGRVDWLTEELEKRVDRRSWPRDLAETRRPRNGKLVTLAEELRLRMLFSCLIDADRLDTERYSRGRGRALVSADFQALLIRLMNHVKALGDVDSPVNAARRDILTACETGGTRPPGLYSLTAPTGSGKTLAGMAFALRHVVAHRHTHGFRRIIVVLPFLSIIEQNVGAYRRALGLEGSDLILEHHSGVAVANDEDREEQEERSEGQDSAALRARQAAENWDAPIVVTTAVQFLESLFSRRPGRCRKLHNIGRSVVIFDEAQTLPFPLLDPILSAVRSLAADFGVTFLFSTATRAAFAKGDNLPSGLDEGECVELLESSEAHPGDPETYFRLLRRTSLELPFLKERWSWSDLADRIEGDQALIIVNLRKHAQDLHNILKGKTEEGVFHLSSTMCAEHRSRVLGSKTNPEPGSIHYALKTGRRCVLVSTQVVEAGVDLDFPVVYRAIAPLEAIIQAAGRCDREGKLTKERGRPGGRVIVFNPAVDHAAPPGFYSEATEQTKLLLDEHAANPDRILEDPSIFARFHQHLIEWRDGAELGRRIQENRRGLLFQEVDKEFKVIESAGQGVVVPYASARELLDQIRQRGYETYGDRRRLQRFMVSLFPNQFNALLKSGVIRPIFERSEGLMELTGHYDKALGVVMGELPVEDFAV